MSELTREPPLEIPAEPEPRRGTPPTADDTFYLEWAKESIKNNLKLANEILRQLVSLMSLLLAGTGIFLNEAYTSAPAKIAVLGFFFLGLICAFVGVLPYEAEVATNSVSAIKHHKQKALRWKRGWIWATGVFLAAGFGVFVTSVVLQLIH